MDARISRTPRTILSCQIIPCDGAIIMSLTDFIGPPRALEMLSPESEAHIELVREALGGATQQRVCAKCKAKQRTSSTLILGPRARCACMPGDAGCV